MESNKVGKLEALLFSQGSEMQKKNIMKLLDVSLDELHTITTLLERSCSGRGIVLAQTESTLALRSAPEHAHFLNEIHKKTLSGDIGKAGLETLAVLLYRGPSTRSEIDFIRGVNSSFILRNLMVRGLVEKKQDISVRQFTYQPTVQALSVMGVDKKDNLPEYDKIHTELHSLEQEKTE